MPLQTYTEAQAKEHIAKLKPSLAFVLSKAEVDLGFQAVLGANNITSLARFSIIGEDPVTVQAFIKDQLGLDVARRRRHDRRAR